jgi:hypothetical protein
VNKRTTVEILRTASPAWEVECGTTESVRQRFFCLGRGTLRAKSEKRRKSAENDKGQDTAEAARRSQDSPKSVLCSLTPSKPVARKSESKTGRQRGRVGGRRNRGGELSDERRSSISVSGSSSSAERGVVESKQLADPP